MNKKNLLIEIFLLTAILSIAFFIRIKDINKIPYGIDHDELQPTVSSFLDLYNIPSYTRGVWEHFYFLSKSYPVAFKFNQLSFYIFGPDLFSPRKMSVIISIFSLVFFYFASRIFFPKITAFIILVLFAFSPHNLITSKIPMAPPCPPYLNLFFYTALILLLKAPLKKGVSGLFFIFFASLAYNLTALTANIGIAPLFIGLLILLIRTITNDKVSLKLKILFILIFITPSILLANHYYKNLSAEISLKSYGVQNSIYDFKTFHLDFNKLKNNAISIYRQFFVQTNGDMHFYYPKGPLVNIAVSILTLIGLFIGLIKYKKYYPLFLFFIIFILGYHLILGLNFPRWWILTISASYLIAGISLDFFLNFIKKKFHFLLQLLIFTIFFLGLSYIINSELTVYYQYALKSPYFNAGNRDIWEITKQFKKNLGNNLVFIIPEEYWYVINMVNACSAFNYLVENPSKKEILKSVSNEKFGILTETEFNKNPSYYLVNKKIAIIHNSTTLSTKNIPQLLGFKLKSANYQDFIVMTK